MERKKFEEIAAESIEKIPEKFLRKLENVIFVVENEPNREQREKFSLDGDMTLFGLYEGTPRSGRAVGYSGSLPDRITIFQRPIEENAGGNEDSIRKIVYETIWHEIAHHFGMDEMEVEEAEKRKTN